MIFQVAVSLIDSISQAGRQAKQTEHFSDLRATWDLSNQKISFWVQNILWWLRDSVHFNRVNVQISYQKYMREKSWFV